MRRETSQLGGVITVGARYRVEGEIDRGPPRCCL